MKVGSKGVNLSPGQLEKGKMAENIDYFRSSKVTMRLGPKSNDLDVLQVPDVYSLRDPVGIAFGIVWYLLSNKTSLILTGPFIFEVCV